MEKTEHLELNKWAQTDRILMDDFNSDNDKLDAALGDLMGTVETHTATLAQHAALLPKLGNCQIYTTSYVGTGNGDPGLILTFSYPVLFLAIMPDASVPTQDISSASYSGYYVRGGRFHIYGYDRSYLNNVELTNSGKTFRMFSSNYSGADIMNYADRTYHVVALLAADQ